MESDKDPLDQIKENLEEEHREREPFITFYAYPVEMWFWRIAVPIALVCALLALFK